MTQALPKLFELHSNAVANVIAEYAKIAPKGSGERAILAQVRRDYPEIPGAYFGRILAGMHRAPEKFSALAPFVARDHLSLRGLVKKIAPEKLRYAGG